ncbi:unnamed protein product [Cyprideis torosa]|uniref:Uncharacterized protein n=1 Tax=Cyprideis torosa TaxID=163714 RepID=A0A7R8ZG95_9CRUS|nr:unnamed protein product [Cyprideis torosa]CAG0879546.1 unnamed protein product [Cyprideis torosa]
MYEGEAECRLMTGVAGAMPEQSNDYRVVVFGAGGVGKSSLVMRFVKGTFKESYVPTIEDTYRQDRGVAGAMPEQSNDYRVVVFGAGGVGKSSLVMRFVKGTFKESYVPTIEDTYRQVISCNNSKNVCTLQITDTTGSHQFPAMQRLNISKGHAFILVYSVTSRQSFEELPTVYRLIWECKTNLDGVPVMLVGNKCDEVDSREVVFSEGEELAKRWECKFMETSAKTNYNVKELFQELLNLEKNRNISLTLEPNKSGKVSVQHTKKRIREKCSLM